MTVTVRVNYIQHLNAFFAQIRKDDQLRANHISLYLALFQVWNQYRFRNPFPILREEIIRLCHIGSLNTYTRCLKELHTLGYIKYQPAAQRGAPSLICVKPLKNNQSVKESVQLSLFQDNFPQLHPFFILNRLIEFAPPPLAPYRKSDTGIYRKTATERNRNNDTPAVAKMGPFNNKQVNVSKSERKNTHSPPKKNNKNETKKDLKSAAAAAGPQGPPSLLQVQEFFRTTGYPDQEGRKFFYHYQGNGWRQGGKIPLGDWQAAAHKWMLNANSYKNQNHDIRHTKSATQPGGLHTNEDKSYSDPL